MLALGVKIIIILFGVLFLAIALSEIITKSVKVVDQWKEDKEKT